MALSIILSFIGEGPTDNRFFPNIAERIIEQLLLEQNIEATIQWQTIEKSGVGSIEIILNAARQSKYCTILIIHSDAEDRGHQGTLTQKLTPGLEAIEKCEEDICKNIAIVIPITETEAWMLVDKDLLRNEMNTNLTAHELGLTYQLNRIEAIADPKQKVKDAIHSHHQQLTRKRRRSAVEISELYEPISRKIELRKLEILTAYAAFKQNLIISLRNKNILN